MTYQHRHLGRNEIRLLRLVSAAEYHYELLHVSLEPWPAYTALSYTWGEKLCPNPIRLDNCSFYVTQNLHDALGRLQNHDRAGLLWADAICVDQTNDDEKNHQVGMMG